MCCALFFLRFSTRAKWEGVFFFAMNRTDGWKRTLATQCFSFFDTDTENFVFDIPTKSTAMCESYYFLENSTMFFCVLFTCSLTWYSVLGKQYFWILLKISSFSMAVVNREWELCEICTERKQTQHTTEEMMMKNFLYGSSDGKLGPIALDFYYALQWMTLLSECGCSSWGAYCRLGGGKSWKLRERAREKACREGKNRRSLSVFCVDWHTAHWTLARALISLVDDILYF